MLGTRQLNLSPTFAGLISCQGLAYLALSSLRISFAALGCWFFFWAGCKCASGVHLAAFSPCQVRLCPSFAGLAECCASLCLAGDSCQHASPASQSCSPKPGNHIVLPFPFSPFGHFASFFFFLSFLTFTCLLPFLS